MGIWHATLASRRADALAADVAAFASACAAADPFVVERGESVVPILPLAKFLDLVTHVAAAAKTAAPLVAQTVHLRVHMLDLQTALLTAHKTVLLSALLMVHLMVHL